MAHSTHMTTPKGDLFGNPAVLFEAAVERFGRYLQFRRTLAELSRLSDLQLADLGLNRSMLRATAFEATYGVN